MAALMVSIAVMSILASVAMPVWRHQAKREREAELIFRAGQYVHAIEMFKKKFAGAHPPDIDTLIKQKFLRKKYKDPMTKDGEWRIVTPNELQGAPMGGVPTTQMPGQSGFSGGNSSLGRPGTGGPGPMGQPGSTSGSFGSGSSSTDQSGTAVRSSFSGDGAGRTVNMGPIAGVASKSKDRSIRIFKGRDRYDQWIVTIDDVMRRQMVSPQSPGQPGQPGRPSGSPGFGSPGGSPSPSPSSPPRP